MPLKLPEINTLEGVTEIAAVVQSKLNIPVYPRAIEAAGQQAKTTKYCFPAADDAVPAVA